MSAGPTFQAAVRNTSFYLNPPLKFGVGLIVGEVLNYGMKLLPGEVKNLTIADAIIRFGAITFLYEILNPSLNFGSATNETNMVGQGLLIWGLIQAQQGAVERYLSDTANVLGQKKEVDLLNPNNI